MGTPSPLSHLLFFRSRLAKLRKLLEAKAEAGEEGGRSRWSSWRNHLPCWRRRKIHPAKGSGAAGTSSLPTAVAVAPAVAERRAPGETHKAMKGAQGVQGPQLAGPSWPPD